MSAPNDKQLYEQAKRTANKKYAKPFAYKSGFIVQEYKRLGGTYDGEKTKLGLSRWFKEKWTDIGSGDYPVYRPTKRISAKTPLTVGEINKKNLKKQIELKQKIRGESNLPPFLKK